MQLYNIIKNQPKYWLVDQIHKKNVTQAEYQRAFRHILDEWHEQQVGYLSVLMDEAHENWPLSNGFEKVTSIVEYERGLDALPEPEPGIEYHALSGGRITGSEYAALYDLCRTGSANKNEQQKVDEVMDSLERELGPNWREHCYYFQKDEVMLGIGIPHIEMGTQDEGRLFYFGVAPEARGRGVGSALHKITLKLLKKMGASYYVGSTDTHNTGMIKIFQKNDCVLRDQKGMYRIEKKG
ncbi:GNAT family N-acetyltransferase [Lentibacillus sediminis]|uniref:GNAT family N-acetyltransferase n=1 Tax=Lentibacillus sediminis TaxID=1940529 RepID=UPI0013043C3D|nr:GNAT family N-acetyltransferase [Lentibacillus sediminis]